MSLILLDSPVASGVLANLLDRGNQAEKSESWILTVSDLLKKAPDGSKVTIPTPVYYELAAMRCRRRLADANPELRGDTYGKRKAKSKRIAATINHENYYEAL